MQSKRHILILVTVAAVCLTAGADAQPRRAVTLYAGGDFSGASETFYGDVPDMTRTRVGNDHASSVRVAPGCVATLYAGGNYQGRSMALDRDIRSLAGTEVGNDTVSSLRLRCDGSPAGGPGGNARDGVALYRGAGFNGTREVFYEDDPDLRNNRIGGTASSVRVGPGCRATLYSEPGYRGRSEEIGSDVHDLGRTRLGNGGAASLRVRCDGQSDPWNDRRDDRRGNRRDDRGSGGGWNPWGDDRPGRGRDGATLYAGGNYSGRSEAFYGDVDRLHQTKVGNDTVSSVQVAPGCQLELFEHPSYQGNSVVLTDDEPDMRHTLLGNDRASSLRLTCGRGGYGDYPGNRGGVTLFAGGGYSGRSETFYGDVDRLSETTVGNDTVSSLQVAPGCRLELFEHPDYGGHSNVLTGDVPDMRRTSLGNDRASSLRLDCGRRGGGRHGGNDRGVTVYRGGNFTGGSETFFRDVRDLSRTAVGNDEASSVRVSPGCRAVLYRHGDFRGESVVLTRDAENLSFTAVGNDALSSIEVDCR